MNGQNQSPFSRARPYLVISLAGILAFAPVSFMLKALKNDIVAIEYPINYFISQCIHNGEIPYWFNTWGMGFPLQSNLTWGIYSTPQIIFSSLFDYNVYVLHIEFMFFVLLSGWGMFYLLKRYIIKDLKPALVLAICYMLSGFIVGSSQWLLYITAAAFIPIVISSLLRLMQSPSFYNAIQFAVMYSVMFTSVYAAFNIITTYALVAFMVIYFLRPDVRERKLKILRYTALAALFTLLLCLPCLYYTTELLKYIDRGSAIAGSDFFKSNYLHPAGLSSMLLPFSSVKMRFPNTEGTMINSYTGLFVLLFLPLAIWKTIKGKNQAAIVLLVAALLFLMASFGAITPFRTALNILPGFSYFRNPGIFRLYFILSLIIYLAVSFRNFSWFDLIAGDKANNILKFSFYLLIIICTVTLLANSKSLAGLSLTSAESLIKNLNLSQAIAISSAIQLCMLVILFVAVIKKYFRFAAVIFITDLIVNTFICTPYFTVSSYSLPEVSQIFHSESGFPVQQEKINEAVTVFRDKKMNTWYNINVYNKQVSSNSSYRGPLTLQQFSAYFNDTLAAKKLFDHSVVIASNDLGINNDKVKVDLQKPAHIRVVVDLPEGTTITMMQNNFPGWKAYYNNKPVNFIDKDKPGLAIAVPEGKATIDFRYEKKGVWISALLFHLIIISFLVLKISRLIKRKPSDPLFLHS